MTLAPWPPVDLAYRLDEILFPVIDGARGAELFGGARLVAAPHRHDHLGAERGGDLDRRGADAAGAAMHQQPLAGLQGGAFEHVVPDGEDRLRQRRRLGESEALRHRQGGGLGRHGELGIAAAIDQRTDEIAVLEARRARTAANDFARDFETEQVGRAFRRGIESLTLEHVGPVDAGGGNLDQHLAATGARHRPRGRHQNLGPAGLLRFDDRHGLRQHQSLIVLSCREGGHPATSGLRC